MPRRKSLKVIVDIECHAVTCPGVFLPQREDVFINIEIFGQLKRTNLLPPVFPFLFHEKIRFEKVFYKALDPVQIAQELCCETVKIDLLQLSYPGGDILGSFSDNAREFLFPTPRVTPTYPGVDREILFERSTSFPGIAPKLEFSSRTTIKEVTCSGRSQSENCHRGRAKTAMDDGGVSSKSKGRSDKALSQKQKNSHKKCITKSKSPDRRGRHHRESRNTNRGCTMYGYEQPTVASRARSPSPYAHRRMAELSIKDPFESATKSKPYKTEIDTKPDFVVRKVASDTLSLERTPPPPKSPRQVTTPSKSYGSPASGKRYQLPLGSSSNDSATRSSPPTYDGAIQRIGGSLENILRKAKKSCLTPRRSMNSHRSCSEKRRAFVRFADASDPYTPRKDGSPTTGLSATRSPSRNLESSFSMTDLDEAPLSSYERRTLQERLGNQSSPYEKIRDRVRALLQSPRAARIADEAKLDGEERYRRRRSPSHSPSVSVRLNDTEYWNEMAAIYKGKSHRAVFEDNLDKIYDDIYSKLQNGTT